MRRWVLVLGVLWICLVVLFYFYRGVMEFRKYNWLFSNFGINIMTLGKERAVLQLLKENEGLCEYVDIPMNLVVEMGNGRNQIALSSLWEARKYEQGGVLGRDTMIDAASRSFGIPIQVVFLATNSSMDFDAENLANSLWVFSRKSAGASLWKKAALYVFSNKMLTKCQFVPSNISERVFKKEKQADGQVVTKIDPEVMRLWATRRWYVDSIASARPSVYVTNASGVEGIGRSWGLMLEISGFKVIRVDAESVGTNGGGGCFVSQNSDKNGKKERDISYRYLLDYLGCEKGDGGVKRGTTESDFNIVVGRE